MPDESKILHFPKPMPPPTEIVEIFREDNTFCAVIGLNLMDGLVGFGNTISEALRALAAAIEQEHWKGSL